MPETDTSEINVDELMERIREAAERRAAAVGPQPVFQKDDRTASAQKQYPPAQEFSATPAPRPSNGRPGSAPLVTQAHEAPRLILQPEFQPSPDDRYHVNDLLKYHDKDFVRNAYRAVLKREPDEEGFARQLASLREGRFDKIDLLAALRSSPEGEGKRVQIDGLGRPALLRRAGRAPVVGYLIRLAFALVNLPSLLQAQRQFEAHSLAQHQQAAEFINDVISDLYGIADRAAAHRRDIESLARQTQQTADDTRQEVELLTAAHGQLRQSYQEEFEWLRQDYESTHAQLRQDYENAQSLLRQDYEGTYSQLRRELKETREDAYQRLAAAAEQVRRQAESLSESVEERAKRLARDLQQTRTELTLQERRLSLLVEEARKRLPAPFDEHQLRTLADEGGHVMDAFYSSFEDRFRGSRAEVKQRLQVYLPYLERAEAGGGIVDIGCGRGEWLEVLREAGLRATGVDHNRVMVERCRGRGLDVVEGDALAYLRGLPDNSLRAVTAFHFIEHLPFATLIAYLREVLRVLRPGGLLACETPNPENLTIGGCNFYLDPDHHKPLPSALTSFLLEAKGFCRVEVVRLNANDPWRVDEASELALRFNEFMYGSQDYAVIGWKV